MNKKQLTVVCLMVMSLVAGCNYLRTFPLYSEVWIEHPEHIKLFEDYNIDYFIQSLPDSDVTKTYLSTKAQVSDYLDKHKDLSKDISTALNELKIKKGMTTGQVILVIGEPAKKKISKDGIELWVYNQSGIRQWYYKWGKLRFKDGILVKIRDSYRYSG